MLQIGFPMMVAAAFASSIPTASPATANSAPAQGQSNCSDDRGADRCGPEQQRRMRAVYGVRSIEEHQAAGDQVRRIYYAEGRRGEFYADSGEIVLIAFVRAAGRDPEVIIYYPRRAGEAAVEPLRAPVPQAVWDEAIRQSEMFDRDIVPRDGEIVICTHAWSYTIEATDPRIGFQSAETRRAIEDDCEHGPSRSYARWLQETALSLFPHCAALDRDWHRSPETALSACRLLGGDRLAAAEVLNLANVFRRNSTPDEAGLAYGRFSYLARIDWNGTRNAGDGSAFRFWIGKMVEEGRPSFFIQSVNGENVNRVRLLGVLSRSLDMPEGRPSRYERARIEQIWTRNQGLPFTLESVTVGPWRPSGP